MQSKGVMKMRLIDADTLVKNLGFLYTKNRVPNVPIDVRAKETLTTIMEQATAYDVDKVVEQLNKIKKYNLNLADMMLDIQSNGTNRHFICLEDAIKIVKAGGNS